MCIVLLNKQTSDFYRTKSIYIVLSHKMKFKVKTDNIVIVLV